MKTKIYDFISHGSLNLWETVDKSLVITIRYKKGDEIVEAIVPIIRNFAYCDDPEIYNVVEKFTKGDFVKDKRLEIKAYFSKTGMPDFEKSISRYIPIKGGVKNSKVVDMFIKADYSVLISDTKLETAPIRDYTELREKDPFAKKICEENRKELTKYHVLFENLNLTAKLYFESFQRDLLGVILSGPAGTGKSWLGRIYADKMNAPFLTVQIDGGTQVDDLIGKYVPDGEKGWKFVEGPILKGWNQGFEVIIEEANFGKPEVMSTLYQYLEGKDYVTIDGITYKRHPNFCVVMTMNPGYNGTIELPPALVSRVAIINVPRLTKEEYADRMYSFSKKILSKEFYEKLFDFSNKIEKMGHTNTFHENIVFSVREAQGVTKIILSRRLSSEEFPNAFYPFYIDKLNCDNDNSDAVEALKKDPNIISDLFELYELYSKSDFGDYAETDEVFEFEGFDESEEVKEEKTDPDDDVISELDLSDFM